MWGKNSSFVADAFRTDFENQIVTDLDANAQQVLLYNLKGQSFSNSLQAEWNIEPIKKLELRLAYKWQDVQTTYGGNLLQKPLVNRSRILVNLGYATRFDKWKYDITYKWFDQARLPNTQGNPAGLQMMAYSPTYHIINAQVTRAFKKWEIYVGIENATNFVQSQQIIDPQNPFGTYFDASLIWGPIMGRVFYSGIRLTLK
jgi:outer membrane receptor for ferrienterochelin and colicins